MEVFFLIITYFIGHFLVNLFKVCCKIFLLKFFFLFIILCSNPSSSCIFSLSDKIRQVKFTIYYLKPLCPEILQDLPPLNNDEEYVSCDIDSFFTNILLKEIIDYSLEFIHIGRKMESFQNSTSKTL